MLAVATLALVVAIVAPVQQAARSGASGPVTLAHAQSAQALDQAGSPTGTRLIAGADSVALEADTLPSGFRLLSQVPTSLAALAIAAGAWCLTGVLRTIRAGRPFDRRNPARLAAVAIAVLMGAALAPILGDVIGSLVIAHLYPGSPVVIGVQFSLAPLLVAVPLMGAAEASRRGTALGHDVSGLA